MKTEKRKNRKPRPDFNFALTLFPCSSSAALFIVNLLISLPDRLYIIPLVVLSVSLCVFVYLYLSLLLSASFISYFILRV